MVKFSSYYDLHLEIESKGLMKTKPIDKRSELCFANVNVTSICSTSPGERYISQLYSSTITTNKEAITWTWYK